MPFDFAQPMLDSHMMISVDSLCSKLVDHLLVLTSNNKAELSIDHLSFGIRSITCIIERRTSSLSPSEMFNALTVLLDRYQAVLGKPNPSISVPDHIIIVNSMCFRHVKLVFIFLFKNRQNFLFMFRLFPFNCFFRFPVFYYI